MKSITVFSSKDFREWLKNNYDKEERVALTIYKKHTGKPSPSHRELINEAICYGWIDTTIKRLDDNKFIRHFSRRTKNSSWSDNTLRYAKELKKAGRMTEAGLKFYKLGLAKPVHDDGIPKNPDMPEELRNTLTADSTAKKNFDQFPPSTKKMFYRWILSGKRKETRDKRIKLVLIEAEKRKQNEANKS